MSLMFTCDPNGKTRNLAYLRGLDPKLSKLRGTWVRCPPDVSPNRLRTTAYWVRQVSEEITRTAALQASTARERVVLDGLLRSDLCLLDYWLVRAVKLLSLLGYAYEAPGGAVSDRGVLGPQSVREVVIWVLRTIEGLGASDLAWFERGAKGLKQHVRGIRARTPICTPVGPK